MIVRVRPPYIPAIVLLLLLFTSGPAVHAQIDPVTARTDTIPPIPSFQEREKKWGPRDTVIVGAIWYGTDRSSYEMMPYHEESNIWVSRLSPQELVKRQQEWTRLRNAVYVTYPYARTAGVTINEINRQLVNVTSKKERKDIIKRKEKELKKQFSDPLSNLSVYQGRVLMKLINRQTGNNCYEIIKEFKGGLNARMYQTVAFFFGGNLKQQYDVADDPIDRQIETFVREIDGNWYGNPYRR